ncbi:hypothetical protein DSUL_20486 [Desulfovibrionales bacterium]
MLRYLSFKAMNAFIFTALYLISLVDKKKKVSFASWLGG